MQRRRKIFHCHKCDDTGIRIAGEEVPCEFCKEGYLDEFEDSDKAGDEAAKARILEAVRDSAEKLKEFRRRIRVRKALREFLSGNEG